MWQQEAACQGTDVNLFIVVDMDHPEASGLDDSARKALTIANFKKAEAICSSCPVRAACQENMTEDDRTWTLRAGLWPKKFTIRTAGRPKKFVKSHRERVGAGAWKRQDGTCQRGHGDWDKDGRCRPCRLETKRRSNAKSRAALKAARVVQS